MSMESIPEDTEKPSVCGQKPSTHGPWQPFVLDPGLRRYVGLGNLHRSHSTSVLS